MATAAVVSVSMGVMKPVLAKLTTLLGDEYKKLKGLRKEVTFLQRELSDMDAVLEKMDGADELDPQAKKWRKDIIEMSYNIEDFIDDFIQRVGETNNNKMGILRKASKYLRTFKDRRDLANQFQQIKSQVMEASDRRKRYMLDQCISNATTCISITTPVAVDPRISALYKESASLVGIDDQKSELVNWAVDKGRQLKMMAIVGFGGLGKTTLANEVYREVGGKFDCTAFVSVSQKPEMVGLFNSLLSQLGLRPYSHACQLQDPINDLRGHLQDKRYFIIIDDLWDTRAWDIIQCAFPKNYRCSRVMITTRNENVARLCCGNHGCIHDMKPLSEQDSRKLFFDRIFGSEDACPSLLIKPSCEILERCGGLPLAIITMASMLACQPIRLLEGQWEHIQNTLASKFATDSKYEDMMHILDLSYKNLPRHLKACFLYLGSYPEDHLISRLELVRQWVAEGFVSTSGGQDVWDVAESYFNELVNRSMIQPQYTDFVTGVSFCKVHDMLLELIVRRCKEDNFLSLVNDSQAVVVEAQDKVIRRLTVVGLQGIDDGEGAITIAGNLSQIRSLMILQGSNWVPPLAEFKFVRVLFLCVSYRHEMAFDLTVINHLSHLKYLKVEGDDKSIVLPGQIRVGPLLDTLDLSRVTSSSISLEIVDVPRLSHLAVPKHSRLPDRICEVKSLRTLRGFSLPNDSLESIVGLSELTTLSELFLYCPAPLLPVPAAAWMGALSTSLEKLGSLKDLCLGPFQSLEPIALCADALSLLSPAFHNLEKLHLHSGCTFSRVPRWIGHLHSLRELWIGVKQLLREDVVLIGTRLPSLAQLGLRVAGVPLGRIVIGGSTGFPALKRFVFDCDWVSSLRFEAGAMCELRELRLVFDADEWDMAAPGGLQHLPSLEKIRAIRAHYGGDSLKYMYNTGEEVAALIRSVFEEAADAVPTRPDFTLSIGSLWRPREEED